MGANFLHSRAGEFEIEIAYLIRGELVEVFSIAPTEYTIKQGVRDREIPFSMFREFEPDGTIEITISGSIRRKAIRMLKGEAK